MTWNDTQIKNAQRTVENGGVAVNPVWLARRAEALGTVRLMLDEIKNTPHILSSYDVRCAIVSTLERMIGEVQGCLDDTARTPPVRDVFGIPAPPPPPFPPTEPPPR